MQVWKNINLKDLITKLPRTVTPIRYEVSNDGKIRKYNPTDSKLSYTPVDTIVIGDIQYLSIVLGWAYGVELKTTIPVELIVKKCFH